MSDSHDEPTGFGKGIGQFAGYVLLAMLGMVVLSWAIAAVRFVIERLWP